jgi:hypothetical protein
MMKRSNEKRENNFRFLFFCCAFPSDISARNKRKTCFSMLSILQGGPTTLEEKYPTHRENAREIVRVFV